MGRFFLGVVAGAVGAVAVGVIGRKLDDKIKDFILDALNTDRVGVIPDAGPDSVPKN